MCKHCSFLTEEMCGLCSGTREHVQSAYLKKKRMNTSIYKKTMWQKKSLETADRHSEPIEDWEIEKYLQGIKEGDAKDWEKHFNIAVELGRSFNAMVWWFTLMFEGEKAKSMKNSHAKDLISRFIKYKMQYNEKVSLI